MTLTERLHNVRLIIPALVFSLFPIEAGADPERVNKPGTHSFPDARLKWKEVGRGEMSWLWIDIYRTRLLTPDGRFYAAKYPKILPEYHR